MDQYPSNTMLGSKPKQALISTGNETFDKFLGGGFLNSSLNLFERQGPSSKLLDAVWNRSLAASTLASKNALIFINFNTLNPISEDQLLSSLPLPRKVKTEMLYKDTRGKSATAQIKIAWRYSSRSYSPSDSNLRSEQIDFGLSLSKEVEESRRGPVKIINVEEQFSLRDLICSIDRELSELKKTSPEVNIIVQDLLHPFSPLLDDNQLLCKFMFLLRSLARTVDKGAILTSYDIDLCSQHSQVKNYIYNLADCVVSFYSYETGQSKLTGYKNTDGTLDYLKVPKINTFGPHFQRELSDWGYRFTKNHRFFVIDELSLPPCHDDEEDDNTKKKTPSDLTDIEHKRKPLKQVGPLEDFREVAEDVIPKRL